jgi:CheY-like chemotaxis protein
MAAAEIEIREFLPALPATSDARVILVDCDPRASALLGRYLGELGWTVTYAPDARRALRQSGGALSAPFLVLKLDEDDPDAFELLAAVAARAMRVSVIACTHVLLPEDAEVMGICRVLGARPRFSEVAHALEGLREDAATARLSSVAAAPMAAAAGRERGD